MDIYNFIQSKDVAKYCRKINHQFNTLEMAVLIGRSRRTMIEKHTAWRELISDYPDMPMPEHWDYNCPVSLHQRLAKMIECEESWINLFKTSENGAVYMYNDWGEDDDNKNIDLYSTSVFLTFEETIKYMREKRKRDGISSISIYKKFICDDDSIGNSIRSMVDYDGNLYFLHSFKEMNISALKFYCNCKIDIPTPFKRGDILIGGGYGGNIFVLDSIKKDSGFFVSDSGVLYGDCLDIYDSLEYYRGKLEGKDSLLHYVSLYLKNKIGLPEILTMHTRIISQHQLDKNLPIKSPYCYIDDNLLAENRIIEEENNKENRL